MKRRASNILILTVAALVFLPLAAWAADNPQVTVLELESEGMMQVRPDKASINFSMVTDAPQAQEAAKANAVQADTFLAAVKKVLGPEEKVKTLQYQVMPLFRQIDRVQGKEKIRTSEITGYRASNLFQVELRDLTKIGPVADTALKNGANEVQGPYFSHTQQEDLQNQAAVKALERARKLADALAQATGTKVKRVMKMSTTHPIYPRMQAMAKAAPAGGVERDVQTPVEVGDITYQSRLTVTFELAP
jgi:uncharacterized protein